MIKIMQNSFYQRTGLTLHRELVQLSPENWFSSQQRTGLALSRNLVQLTAEIWFNFLLRTSSAPTRELVQLSSENWFSSQQRTGSAPSRELVQLPVCIEYKGTVNVTQNFGNLEEEVQRILFCSRVKPCLADLSSFRHIAKVSSYKSIKYKRLSMIVDIFLEANHFYFKILQGK